MNASSKHVYNSDKEVKGRKNKFYFKRKFKQDTGEEDSVASSYLSLSGHDGGGTWQSSMSYVSVDGTGTLSDLSSGYLSVAENQDSEHDDSEYDESSNSRNNCFSCFHDGIETLATHLCQTCRPENKFICHKCLQQHNKFCEGHDVLSLSVKHKQQTEQKGNSSDYMNVEQDFNYNSYDQAVLLAATRIHFPLTDLSNQKDKMQESGKNTLHEPASMDHKKESDHQQTIPSTQSVIPATDSPDELKHTLMPTRTKPLVFSAESVPLRSLDKASQTDFSDEMKHSSVQMCEKEGLPELLSSDSVQFPATDRARNDYHQTKRSNFTSELVHFAVRNKNERNQCHFQKKAEPEEENRDRASRRTLSETETNVLNINTFADENLLKIANSSESFHDASLLEERTSQNEGWSLFNINFYSEKRVYNANGNTDFGCGKHEVKDKRNERQTQKVPELKKEYMYDNEESSQLKTGEFTNVLQQLQPKDVARYFQKIKSKDLSECSEKLVESKAGDENKILQSVSEYKRSEWQFPKVSELIKTLLYDEKESSQDKTSALTKLSCLVKTLEFIQQQFIQQLPPEKVTRIFRKISEILEALKAGDKIVEFYHLLLMQSVSKRCKKTRSYRPAVVTPEVSEEALRQCQIYDYDLTYSNYFPRDCKMFVAVPVYRENFINRRDKNNIEK